MVVNTVTCGGMIISVTWRIGVCVRECRDYYTTYGIYDGLFVQRDGAKET